MVHYSTMRRRYALAATAATAVSAFTAVPPVGRNGLFRLRAAGVSASRRCPLMVSTPVAVGVEEEGILTRDGSRELAGDPIEGERRAPRGKTPEFVIEGDTTENTPKMIALVAATFAFAGALLSQAVGALAGPADVAMALGAYLSGVALADFVTGVFHWSVDNYGDINTPVFGAVIEAFQGHHESPWTITYRPFANNIHKICYGIIPLLSLLALAHPGSLGTVFGVSFLVSALLSQEFHKYAHMVDPPAPIRALQDSGVLLSRRAHGRHHSSPFEGNYCIVNGMCNDAMDRIGMFRALEVAVYRLTGEEPNTWKLDPSIKDAALHGEE